MLKFRVISGALFLSLVAAMAIWAPTWVAALFILALGALATEETQGLLRHAGYPSLRWTTLVLGQIWMLAAWFSKAEYAWFPEPLYPLVPVILAWAVFLGCLFRSDQTNTLRKLTGSFLGLAYVPALMQFLLLLLFSGRGGVDGRMLLVYGILVIKCTDIAAYFSGRAFGKHKLIPRISPAKTWEGVIGGILGAILVSYVFQSISGFRISGIPFGRIDAVAIGLLLGVAGILGDLVESMLKRAADIKDSGTWIRGMGGLLDVLDSLIFAFPVLYLYIQGR